jgi:predicted O-methyltransferase YrrM
MTDFPNWFAMVAEENFAQALLPLKEQNFLRFAQIGTFTGDASQWLLKSVLTKNGDCLDDVDTWKGSDEEAHDAMDFAEVERVYDEKVAPYGKRVRKFKMTSRLFFQQHAIGNYDFIYIDGDHTAQGVLEDALDAHRHLKVGGILGFDDYQWRSGKGALHDPQLAIDAFNLVYQEKYELLISNYQVWLRKISN